MTTISSKGLRVDNSSNLQVSGETSVGGGVNAGYHGNNAQTVDGSGSVSFATPGFYNISAGGTAGAGDFTGSVPSPASYPGAMIIVKDTLGSFPYLLTGSAVETGRALFCKMSGSTSPGASQASLGGTALSVTPKGSVVLVSDSVHWLIMAGSGSFTLSGFNF